MTGLDAAAADYRAWLFGAALPLWCVAAPGGGFVEALDDRGRPVPDAGPTTVRQARQVYVYSHAALLGWPHGLPLAARALRRLRDDAWAEGWVRAAGRDATIDLYDNAFMLLALAWHARATGDAADIAWAHRTLDALEARMRLGDTPGFALALPHPPGPRMMNHHMHVLEALLALHAATGAARFAAAARDLVALFRERLFDAATGSVAEYFGPAWQRLPEAEPGRVAWPGHHCEWAWLLHRAEAQLGLRTGTERRALYRFAERYAVDPASGLLRYAVTEAGLPLDDTIRLWPQTEAARAALAMRRPGHCAAILRSLLARHLSRRPRGSWIETYDAGGRPVPGQVDAGSLYHLLTLQAALRGSA